jgi:hypothetical protein
MLFTSVVANDALAFVGHGRVLHGPNVPDGEAFMSDTAEERFPLKAGGLVAKVSATLIRHVF